MDYFSEKKSLVQLCTAVAVLFATGVAAPGRYFTPALFGFIENPVDDQGNYLPKENREWNISVPVGSIIRFIFQSIDLQNNPKKTRECSHDWVEIFDGPDETYASLTSGRVCNNRALARSFYSTTHNATIEFRTDSDEQHHGFTLYWEEVPKAALGKLASVSGSNSGTNFTFYLALAGAISGFVSFILVVLLTTYIWRTNTKRKSSYKQHSVAVCDSCAYHPVDTNEKYVDYPENNHSSPHPAFSGGQALPNTTATSTC